LVKLFNGENLCKPVSSKIKKRDEQIKKLVSEYVLDGDKDADDISQFLNSISRYPNIFTIEQFYHEHFYHVKKSKKHFYHRTFLPYF